jgi:SAM-dependent methyltransferase
VPTEGYDEELFAETLRAEDRHFWYRSRREIIAAALEWWMRADGPGGSDAGRPPGHAVDLGCGNGNVTGLLRRCLPATAVAGFDSYESGIAHTKHATGAAVVQASLAALPLRPGGLDLVSACDVLEHLEDDANAVGQVRDALAPGGRFLVTVPAHAALWSDFDVASHHYRRYEEQGLRTLLEAAGFAVDYSSPFMAAVYPIARVTRRPPDGTVDAVAVARRELRIRPGLNGVLYRVTRQEARVVRRGRRLPAGTSLLALARRR